MFASIEQAYDMGCVAVGATIYFGSSESTRQIQEVSRAFAKAHDLGMGTILWCYLRNNHFKSGGVDYHTAADLTGQANHLGATLGADIVKQKLPENNGGYQALNMGSSGYGKFDKRIYTELAAITPSISAVTRWRTARWAGSGSSTPAARPRAATISPRPCAPR
jgi:class I fructose-bisphosphate aldolase